MLAERARATILAIQPEARASFFLISRADMIPYADASACEEAFMLTVGDVLRRIERIKKDLEYVRTFLEKWRDQRDRFPKIYEGILEQERAFVRKIDELKGLHVEGEGLVVEAEEAKAPAQPVEEEALKPRITPAAAIESVESRGASPAAPPEAVPRFEPRADSSDEKRAAAAEIGEKLRKRAAASPPEAGAQSEQTATATR